MRALEFRSTDFTLPFLGSMFGPMNHRQIVNLVYMGFFYFNILNFYFQFKEMMIFLVLWFVIMVSYGVGMTSILIPQKISLRTVKNVLLYPYINALGNLEFKLNQTDRKLNCDTPVF